MTMTTTAEVQEYLTAVRGHLADLTEEERADLLEDLAQHLADVGSEEGGPSLRYRLGDPAHYAHELRVAAGLAPQKAPTSETLKRPSLGTLLRRGGRAMGALVQDLRPAWWVLRGAAFGALIFLWRPDGNDLIPAPVGTVAIFAGVLASVWLGRSADRPAWRLAAIGANGALLVLALLTVSLIPQRAVETSTLSRRPWLVSPHGLVTNIYPYDAKGQPLEGVFLFDQDGRPLRVDFQQKWDDGCRREPAFPRSADGMPIDFSYPRQYRVASAGEFESMFESQRCLPQVPRPTVPVPAISSTDPGAETAPAP